MSKLEDEDDEFAQVKIKKEEVRGVENDFEAFLAREGRVGRVEEGSFQAVMEELQAEREGEGEEYEV